MICSLVSLLALTLVWTALMSFVDADEVCWPPYGCFSDLEPFEGALIQLPEDPEFLRNKFLLHTRTTLQRGLKQYEFLDPLNPYNLTSSSFDPNKKTFIYCHGYIESSEHWYVPELFEKTLAAYDANVIFGDYPRSATFPYFQAFGNLRLVARQLARLVENLRNHTDADLDNIHLIGFSLGAHVAGNAGKFIHRSTGRKVAQITGLDAAGPYYEFKVPEIRLDPTDAQFVDAIHTDTNTVGIKGFGIQHNVGHVDFYPNGGLNQPGCSQLDTNVVRYMACSHYRAMTYWLEALVNWNSTLHSSYHGYPCKSYDDFSRGLCNSCPKKGGCPRMGIHAIDHKKQGVKKQPVLGKFYLTTYSDHTKTFGNYMYHLTLHTGTKFFAGLSGKVYVRLTGSKGTTDEFAIRSSDYNAGSSQYRIMLGSIDVGTIYMVEIKQDTYTDRWNLSSVIVKPMWKNERYAACFNRWIGNSFSQVAAQKKDYCNSSYSLDDHSKKRVVS